LPDGRRVSPTGTVLVTGGFPMQMRVLPQANERYVVVTDGAYGDEHLRIIDTQATTGDPVVSNVDYIRNASDASDPALFFGLALSSDGSRLYVSNGGYDPEYGVENDLSKHYNVVEVFDLAGSPPKLARVGEIHVPFAGGANKQACLPSGMTLSSDGKTLYVAC